MRILIAEDEVSTARALKLLLEKAKYSVDIVHTGTDAWDYIEAGSYDVVLNTDAVEFGGNGLADDTVTHLTNYDPLYVQEHKEWLKLYIPARSAVVLKKN